MHLTGGSGASRQTSSSVFEHDIRRLVQEDKLTQQMLINHRLKTLQVAKNLWSKNSQKEAVEYAIKTGDLACLVDVLNQLNGRPSKWNLDICALVLSKMKVLLDSRHESYVHTACTSLRLVLKDFGRVISTNLMRSPTIGVDLCQEER